MRATATSAERHPQSGRLPGARTLPPVTLVSPIPADRLHALVARAHAWLLELMAWLVSCFANGPLGRVLRAEVREDLFELRRDLARVQFLLALPQITPRRGPAYAYPTSAPRGCRRRLPGRSVRIIARRIRLHGSLRARAATLSRLIETLDAHVARLARAMSRAPDLAPVLVHAFAELVIAQATTRPASPDSS